MDTTQTPKAKLTNEQYVKMLRTISESYRELEDLNHQVWIIETERYNDINIYDDKNEGLYAIYDTITAAQRAINEIREKVRELME